MELTMLDGSGAYRAPLSEAPRLVEQWKSGAAFLDFMSIHGAPVSLKGARVESITTWLDGTITRYFEAAQAERAEKARYGLDD